MTWRKLLLAVLACLHTLPGLASEAGDRARLGMYSRIARDLSSTETRAALELWAEELTRKFDVPATIHFYSDMAKLRHDFNQGEINFVIADAMSLVRHFGIDELAEGFTTHLHTDASLLLLAADGSAGNINLSGKRIAVVEEDSISATYLETLCLRHYRRECSAVLATVTPVKNNHQSVTRLFLRQVDLALVNRHGLEIAKELNPQLGNAGKVIEELSFETQYFGFFSSKVTPAFRTKAVGTILKVEQEPRGRQLLDVFKTEHLAIATPSALKPFYMLEQQYRNLKARYQRSSPTK
jgi:ABC-type phosphate/phosphonate transport system substrate-binding protein